MPQDIPDRVSNSLRRAASVKRSRVDRLPAISQECTDVSNVQERFEVVAGDRVTFVLEARTNEPSIEGAALVELRAFDRHGARQAIPGWAFVSGRVGEYHYIEVPDGGSYSTTRFTIRVPDSVECIELKGHRWKRQVQTEIVGSILNWNSTPQRIRSTATGVPISLPAPEYRQEEEVPLGAGSASIRLPIHGGGSSGRVPFSISYFDDGYEILPVADMPQHKEHGSIVLVESDANINKIAQFDIQIPKEASHVSIQGIGWGGSTPTVLNNAELHFQRDRDQDIWEFLNELRTSDRLILLDTTAPPVGHATLSLRPNNLTLAWTKMGIKVIFLPFSSIQDQAPCPIPGVLQVGRDQVSMVRDWLVEHRIGKHNTYVCSSFPDGDSVATMDILKSRGWNTVYECRDDMEEFNRVGYSKWYNVNLERRIVEKADQVTAVSHALAAKLKSLTQKDVSVSVTPNGVRSDVIDGSAALRTVEALENRVSSKIFGYVGHLTDAWFDWDLVISAALDRPQYAFEIVGHGLPDGLELPDNVRYMGAMTHVELQSVVANWRAGIIPFVESPLTRSVDPNKIYEYFAWGLPCISASMGSVHEYSSTLVYRDRQEFVSCMDQLVEGSRSVDELRSMDQFLEQCSWDARALQTSKLFFR